MCVYVQLQALCPVCCGCVVCVCVYFIFVMPCWSVHSFALSRVLVQLLAVDLDGREHGRHLSHQRLHQCHRRLPAHAITCSYETNAHRQASCAHLHLRPAESVYCFLNLPPYTHTRTHTHAHAHAHAQDTAIIIPTTTHAVAHSQESCIQTVNNR